MNRLKRLLLAGLAIAAIASPAMATATGYMDTDGHTQVDVSAAHPLPVTSNDVNGLNYDAPFAGAVAYVLDTSQTARRSIGANCTVAGNVSVTFSDASTLVVPVQPGWQTFPFAITTVNTSGTTATCTYSNLK